MSTPLGGRATTHVPTPLAPERERAKVEVEWEWEQGESAKEKRQREPPVTLRARLLAAVEQSPFALWCLRSIGPGPHMRGASFS